MRLMLDILALIALTGGLWLIHVYGRTMPTAALAVLWLAATAIMAIGLFCRARLRRAAFLAAYVRLGSPLARQLRGGPVMALRESVLAAVLSLMLIVALIRLQPPEAWAVVVVAAPLLVLAQELSSRLLAPHAGRQYLPELAWRTALIGVAVLMLAALVTLALFRAHPDVGGVSLERAVWHMVDQEQARSAPAQVLLQAAAVKDGLRLWLAQQLMPQPGVSLMQLLAWAVVLAEEAVFVWSYLLLCSSLLIGFGDYDHRRRD